MIKNKQVYVGLSVDILHEGHLNILNKAAKLGKVTVGLLTDEAILTYKDLPHFDFESRKKILQNFKQISKIVPQNTLDYTENLFKLKPDYVVHGDDWKKGVQKKTRAQVIKTLKKWSGKLVEVKYTKDISSKSLFKIFEKGSLPDVRRSKLKRIINAKKFVRVLEAHDALSGLIVENSKLFVNGKLEGYDAIWSSSLADSLVKGKPDDQSVDYSSRILSLDSILEITTKPIIFDADNGGRIEHVPNLVRALERNGVSAMIIEDKSGYKINSLFKNQSRSTQDSIKNFSNKIKVAKEAAFSDDFMVIARIESLILGKSQKDAINRAQSYIKAGADAILIHSKSKNSNEMFKFSKIYKKLNLNKPLVSVPSTYSKTFEKDLIKNNFQIVIYANHLIRASYKAMSESAKEILKNKRSKNIEKKISKISEVLTLIK